MQVFNYVMWYRLNSAGSAPVYVIIDVFSWLQCFMMRTEGRRLLLSAKSQYKCQVCAVNSWRGRYNKDWDERLRPKSAQRASMPKCSRSIQNVSFSEGISGFIGTNLDSGLWNSDFVQWPIRYFVGQRLQNLTKLNNRLLHVIILLQLLYLYSNNKEMEYPWIPSY